MWDINATLDYLQSNAQPASTKFCARYVREALQAGKLPLSNHPLSAKDYGPTLRAAGFREIQLPQLLRAPVFQDSSLFMAGDVAVFEGLPDAGGGFEHGHIQIFDGDDWISDFKQRGFCPAPQFNAGRYKVYRYRHF
jgi:hypothetical protein